MVLAVVAEWFGMERAFLRRRCLGLVLLLDLRRAFLSLPGWRSAWAARLVIEATATWLRW